MTPQQRLFCLEYIKDFNATQAAIRAGYEENSARMQGSRLLTKDDILAFIETLKAERMERVKIDADYVLKRLHEIDSMDVLDILEDDGSIKPLREWPSAWRRSISGIDLAEMFESEGNQKELVGIMKRVKWPDKTKNLELLGKHVDVQAFNERKTVEHIDRSGVLEAARKRAALAGGPLLERAEASPTKNPPLELPSATEVTPNESE